MSKIGELGKKVEFVLKKEGISGLAKKSYTYVKLTGPRMKEKKYIGKVFKDVLFINGVDFNALPHPPRYRVLHQIEQLQANNIDCDQNFYLHLDFDQVRNYRVFIIYRAPYNEELGKFIRKAKELNKTVIYDIDDLVIDTKYTDTIKYLKTMSPEEKSGYDQGVRDMQRTLSMCDAVITTTEGMANELKKYCPKVFINRNTASEEMVSLSEKAFESERVVKENSSIVKLGYFSGSITHNDDFILIQPAIEKLMKKYTNVELHIVGLLDIPKEFESFKDRVIAHPFVNWKELPKLIASIDINLAPLESSIFNEAKSENKWIEAALVHVPTVASNLGAFKRMIQNKETGILCDTTEDWYDALEMLILKQELRKSIGDKAYEYCKNNCTTVLTGYPLAKFLKSMMQPNIAFVLPALNISGGIMVAFEHCRILKEHGIDVTIINDDYDQTKWITFDGVEFPVLPSRYSYFKGSFDKAVATMWSTVNFLEKYSNIKQRFYLVQNFETNFYQANDSLRLKANSKYSPNVPVTFLTISKWCQKWLKEKYEKEARYVPNGIHINNYRGEKRNFEGKIRILIEGDCGVYYKNVDESFKITNQLDHHKFEIWYLSYNAKPKDWYKVDKFFNKVPFEEVSKVYKSCHILLKTSILESFSYPPLEMMATGGYVVAVPNDGNKEYLKHEENCLFYERGNIEEGLKSIYKICEDKELRENLYINGLKTSQNRDWKALDEKIVQFYSS
ncbi:glycosyltransferase [Faecalicoccus acidiformans]|uniref:Glycosyltransferase n=1 Tax=Faecalicoccus acidiformans TaxID=915173 RepID=A0ABS2FMT7_9FIRM|nr:glycosyltransferase [Faecalicoccus acidiformans]MBM6831333.1 glycosyltransferase [Faecalicoccus acidiformans]